MITKGAKYDVAVALEREWELAGAGDVGFVRRSQISDTVRQLQAVGLWPEDHGWPFAATEEARSDPDGNG